MTTKKTRTPRDWRCNECGKRMTLRQAEKASTEGCSCGSVDVDLAPPEPPRKRFVARPPPGRIIWFDQDGETPQSSS